MMSVYEFGEQLITTGDLDPVYVCLWHAKLSGEKLKRWLLAYWCFYHVGTASCIVEQKDYWGAMEQAAASKAWPRSSERRHFRGGAALRAVAWLRQRGMESLWCRLLEGTDLRAPAVMARVRGWYLFGEWISFKVADMLERLELCPVQFRPEDVFNMFDAPKKGAELMAEVHGPARENIYGWAYDQLTECLGHLKAPPRYERFLNIQEVETILCKWKSHRGGHYPVGKDTEEVLHGLVRFARCKTSQQLIQGGAEGGLW